MEDHLEYRRGRFATCLPLGMLYTRSHFWLREIEPGRWRVGLTAYGARLLGEMVECQFEVAPGTPVQLEQKLGWIEGFKTVSDLGSLVDGGFEAHNPVLDADLTLVESDPYGQGWLYEARGAPDPDALDAQHYSAVLDEAIDAMLARCEGCDE